MKNNLFSQSLYSRMRITWKTVHDINKMEDNFALRYVFTYPGIISCAELVPSPRAYARNYVNLLSLLEYATWFQRLQRVSQIGFLCQWKHAIEYGSLNAQGCTQDFFTMQWGQCNYNMLRIFSSTLVCYRFSKED